MTIDTVLRRPAGVPGAVPAAGPTILAERHRTALAALDGLMLATSADPGVPSLVAAWRKHSGATWTALLASDVPAFLAGMDHATIAWRTVRGVIPPDDPSHPAFADATFRWLRVLEQVKDAVAALAAPTREGEA